MRCERTTAVVGRDFSADRRCTRTARWTVVSHGDTLHLCTQHQRQQSTYNRDAVVAPIREDQR